MLTTKYLGAGLTTLSFTATGFSQVLTNTSKATLSVALPFGTLTAGTSTTPASSTVEDCRWALESFDIHKVRHFKRRKK